MLIITYIYNFGWLVFLLFLSFIFIYICKHLTVIHSVISYHIIDIVGAFCIDCITNIIVVLIHNIAIYMT